MADLAREHDRLTRLLALLLRGGVLLAAAILGVGMLGLAWVHDHALDPAHFAQFVRPSGAGVLAEALAASWPERILHLGLLTLLLLPPARLILAAAIFVRSRDWLFAAVSVVVLGVVLLSAVLARVE